MQDLMIPQGSSGMWGCC